MRNRDQDLEWVEIVDQKGNAFDTATRKAVHSNPFMIHKAVHIIIVNEQGEIFLQKRSENKDIQPGKWDSSVGGHLLIGETYGDAARREMLEELGIKLPLLEKMYSYLWKSDRETEMVTTYLSRFDGPFNLDSEEIEQGRFWKISEIQEELGSGELTPNFEEEFSRYLQWMKS